MNQQNSYLTGSINNHITAIMQGLDKDVEKGEDILMLGLASVMFSTLLAPIAPPVILLPLVALAFAISASTASLHYLKMQKKLNTSVNSIAYTDQVTLKPLIDVFDSHPNVDLNIQFNPLKNLKRTVRSLLGGVLINPFWMPIFYMMGIQIGEEKKLGLLNLAIIGLERKLAPRVAKNDS